MFSLSPCDITGTEATVISAVQDKEVKAAVGTSVSLSCRFRYKAEPQDQLFGKFYTVPRDSWRTVAVGNFSCQTDGQLESCEMFSIINVSLNLSSAKFVCEVTIPRPEKSVHMSGNGTTLLLYGE